MRKVIGGLGMVAALSCSDGGERVDTAAGSSAAAAAAAPRAAGSGATSSALGSRDIPAQPIHWDRPDFEAFMATRAGVPVAASPPAPRLASAVRQAPTLRDAPVARYGVEGTLVEAYMLGDPVTSTRAAREVERLAPRPPIVFTSNNMVVVAYDTTPGILRLRRLLTADTSRSGIQKEERP